MGFQLSRANLQTHSSPGSDSIWNLQHQRRGLAEVAKILRDLMMSPLAQGPPMQLSPRVVSG